MTTKVKILQSYNTAADVKNRISLRGAKAKYYHVKALSNGCYLLEPRVLVPREAIPARTLKMLERSIAALKDGRVSKPIKLPQFVEV